MFTYIFISSASFIAGFIDSVAGGGGLITLPALLAAGLPVHVALGTNKFQSMFGTTCALINFSRKKKVLWKVAGIGIPFALVGAAIGTKLVLIIPASIAAKIIVAFIPPLALLVGFSRVMIKGKRDKKMGRFHLFFITPLACLLIGTYDGFLGPGTGTLLILAMVFLSHIGLIHATATAKAFNLASNVGAFVMFLISGCVFIPYGVTMAVFNILGNVVGSHFAISRGDVFIRKILFVSLALLFVYLSWKYF
ncbi:MAG: hypothetical protein COS89_01985 [Deltaproteobacteria bacterium CG07_land_8_20_14_0_80_38_7]|nr:MAG: hypothetical protein COS89_01985 [Deltaproteobacteria bacterium CG07_land_8_20_14_0_80_38_7]